MAEAAHGTRAQETPNRILREGVSGKVVVRIGTSLKGKDVASPMAMILAGAAPLSYADDEHYQAAGRAIREARSRFATAARAAHRPLRTVLPAEDIASP